MTEVVAGSTALLVEPGAVLGRPARAVGWWRGGAHAGGQRRVSDARGQHVRRHLHLPTIAGGGQRRLHQRQVCLEFAQVQWLQVLDPAESVDGLG